MLFTFWWSLAIFAGFVIPLALNPEAALKATLAVSSDFFFAQEAVADPCGGDGAVDDSAEPLA